MSDWHIRNARRARDYVDACARSLIVAGGPTEASFWRTMLTSSSSNEWRVANPIDDYSAPSVVSERGRKGNLFGTLQAYFHSVIENEGNADPIDQIVMFIGSGTRLSPYTQALGNMKSAFPLPDADLASQGYCVGEAAIKSTAACVEALRDGGFDGVVVRWGDEILISGSSLSTSPQQYSDVDAVRFGWRTEPTELLADQKEWLVVDQATGTVLEELSRQPLASLRKNLTNASRTNTDTYVNLGSFAASHVFLTELCSVFKDELLDEVTAANWDPYFWVALHSSSLEEWESFGREEELASRTGFRDLNSSIPSFFTSVQTVKRNLQERLGRELRVSILDFGEPYWLDAGNHQSLKTSLADLFRDTEDGATLRAFLGLPQTLATGGSFIKDCNIAPGVRIARSIVIDTEVRDPNSVIDGGVILRGSYGHLEVSTGGVAIWSTADELTISGPHGSVFRFSGNGTIGSNECTSTLITESGPLPMRYDWTLGTIDSNTYNEVVAGNPISYQAASGHMAHIDPLWLYKFWEQTTSQGSGVDSAATDLL